MEKLSLEKVGSSTTARLAGLRRRPWGLLAGWAAAVVVAAGVGWWAAPHLFPSPTAPDPIPDADQPLVRHLRVLEKWRLYENIDDREFLDALAQPDLFGEESS
jgi:hypothetical protein